MREQNSREIILLSAQELFAQKGYDAVSISDIVKKAGITKPTLYYFFGSKEGLFTELLKIHYDKLYQQLGNVCRHNLMHSKQYDGNMRSLLQAIAETIFSFAGNHPGFSQMSLTLSFAPPASRPAVMVKAYLNRQYQLLEEMFRQIGEVNKEVAGKEQEAAWIFAALIHTHISLWTRGYGKIDTAAAEQVVKQFMYGIIS